MKNSFFLLFALLVSAASFAQTARVDHATAAEPIVIELVQNDGVFVTDHLELAPGDYIFEVTNEGVDKELGFYLQDKTDAQVPNSGLESLIANGQTSSTGVVTLTEGSYRYSCPLNPTPHYRLTVK